MKTLKKYWLAVITLVILPINISAQSLKEKAESGDKEAQYNYAKSLEGLDKQKAFQWFKKSAEQGYALAQCNLGSCYYNGQGIAKNYEQAVYWFRKSAEQGYALAQNNLGACYCNGKGITEDYKQAVYWFRKSAEQGDAQAQNNLGFCYYNSLGVAQNYEQGVYWYRKSAEQGNAQAQRILGASYCTGQGIAKDYEQAVYWYKKSAEQGDAEAQYNLGVCYDNGQGITQNYEQAVYWYRKSADQGNDSAEYALGKAYCDGKGVKENYKLAVEWWSKAADQGNSDAMYCLGNCYLWGTGVEINSKKAVEWYEKGAEHNNPDAEFSLALYYLHGLHVENDSIEAADLLLKSATGGQGEFGVPFYDHEDSNSKAREKLIELSELDNSPKQGYFLTCVGGMYDAMQDFSNAEKYYKLAIDNGSLFAVMNLGVMYYCLSPCTDPSKRIINSYDTKVDEDLILKYNKTKEWKENDNAAYWLEEAVRYGRGYDCFFTRRPPKVGMSPSPVYSILMDMYASGRGTSKNFEKAVDVAYAVCNCLMDSTYDGVDEMAQDFATSHAELVLELALSSDLPQLHNKLFNIYSNIYTYVKNNPNDDNYDLEQIAYSGLGKCYYKGFGVKKDYNKAFNYLSKAAEYYGTGESMRLLAACYRYGRGVKADPNKDKEWSARAAECDNEQARKLQELRSRWGW